MRTQSLEQGPQAQAWEVFSDHEECQGSDADDSSSDEDSSDEDSSSNEEWIRNRLLKISFFLLICLHLVKLPREEMSRNKAKAGGGGSAFEPEFETGLFQFANLSLFFNAIKYA